MRSSNTHGDMSKQVPNSPILRNYHELKITVVKKGQIHGILRYFL